MSGTVLDTYDTNLKKSQNPNYYRIYATRENQTRYIQRLLFLSIVVWPGQSKPLTEKILEKLDDIIKMICLEGSERYKSSN